MARTRAPFAEKPVAENLDRVACELRHKILSLAHRAQTAHVGGALSTVELLMALYWNCLRIDPKNPSEPSRDRFVFSKGHCISALYTVLARRGFFPAEELQNYNKEGSRLPEQPSPGCVPGIEWATGSLGHGLGVGLGMAVAGRIQNRGYNVYVLLGDGECEEGSVWEAAMLAPRLGLGNLTVLIDYNKWQSTGRTNEIMAMDSLKDKWSAFGWTALEVDGHDLAAITKALQKNRPERTPVAIVANTIKGKGVSFIEDDNSWHHRSPTDGELEKAGKELGV